ncbi:MAG: formylglycine-generating enzyme family protein [bacterium]|nr:formylglycine-generating enzyme family protein [bacterium]
MRMIVIISTITAFLFFCSENGTEPVDNEDPVNNPAEIDPPDIEMVVVSAGEFEMGDNFGEGDSNELPVHTVYLDSFYIGKYEITNNEFEKFIEDGGYTNSSYWGDGGFGDYGTEPGEWRVNEWQGGGLSGNGSIPVVGVCWYEAMAFCSWLSAKTGYIYRLPTEAEWEKTARGNASINAELGHQRRYPWGDEIDGSYTNYYQSGDTYENRGGNGGITPVGYFDGSINEGFQTSSGASPYGAYDMAGNIWELCLDWYGADYYSNSPQSNPAGPQTGTYRVMRGGSRHVPTSFVRSAFRENGTNPNTRSASMGFRIVREIIS